MAEADRRLIDDGDGLTFEYLPGVHSLPEVEFLYEEIFIRRSYLKNGVNIPTQAGAVVVDAGANIGLFSLLVLRENPRALIYALEPSPATFALLEKNLTAYSSDAVCLPWLLREKHGIQATLHCYNEAPGESTANPRERCLQRQRLMQHAASGIGDEDAAAAAAAAPATEPATTRVRMKSHTLQELIDRFALERIDLLKIDVEGDEYRALCGLGADNWAKVHNVACEVHDVNGRLGRIVALLRRHGFRVSVARQEGGIVDGYNMVVPRSLELHYVYAVRARSGDAPTTDTATSQQVQDEQAQRARSRKRGRP